MNVTILSSGDVIVVTLKLGDLEMW